MPVARWRTDLRKKCVRVARDDGDERAGARPRRYYDDGRTDGRGRTRTEEWMRWAGRRFSRRSALIGERPRRARQVCREII